MNTRPLSSEESHNLACVNDAGFSSALLFITTTGLNKSILDAVGPVRRLLANGGVHDYNTQGQGEGYKVRIPSVFHADQGPVELEVSLYRPRTKNGDPRIWFRNLRRHAKPNDVCAVFIYCGKLQIINLTASSLFAQISIGEMSPLSSFFISRIGQVSAAANELLDNLKSLVRRGAIPSVCTGSTAVGRSIEAALGIPMNSSRKPDFKGIELKSGRSGLTSKSVRATLFACVPDWDLSLFKSSRAILEAFGYGRGSQFKLYCTVSTRRANSQGLIFEIDDAERLLRERSVSQGIRDFVVWRLSTLEQSLSTKHRETFWVHASSKWIGKREYFILQSVTHTKNPNIPQLERLLVDGGVTMDHLIKRTPTGGAREKGPLFKIAKARIKELFLGQPRVHSFVEG